MAICRRRSAPCPARPPLIDGEIVVPDEQGISRFALLQQALSDGAGHRLVFYAFDLLHLNGWDLARRAARRAQASCSPTCWRRVGPHGGGALSRPRRRRRRRAVRAGVRDWGSRASSPSAPSAPYRPGRGGAWTKTKARPGRRLRHRRLHHLARRRRASPRWPWPSVTAASCAIVGKVGTGFDRDTAEMLLARLTPLRDPSLTLEGAPKDVVTVRPVLTAHVHYATRTATGALRHAVFKGLREVSFGETTPPQTRRLISDADLASISITNPTRRLFGRSGATKLDVAVYYASVGDVMLPHLFGRPVSLVRCPTGRPQDCFFQRHAFTGMPASVGTFESADSERRKEDPDLPVDRGCPRLSRARAVRRRRVPQLGLPAQRARNARPGHLRPRPRRGRALARDWSRPRSMSATS